MISGYREKWNARNETEEQAKMAVFGDSVEEIVFRHTAEHTRDQLQRTVEIRHEDVILEIGAGVGREGAVLAPICREWIGADVSENMLGHLRRRLQNYDNIQTIVVSAHDLAPIVHAYH